MKGGQAAEGAAIDVGGLQSPWHARSGPTRYTGSGSVFGAEAKLIVLHETEAVAARAMDAALTELRQVEKVLSLYCPDSAVCRLNREGVLTRPHSFLVEVLRKAQQLSELSGGAFDVAVQPLWELYAATRKAGRIPEAAEIEIARRKVDWRKVEVAQDRIRLGERGMAITLNALAQGFAADRVLATLRSHSIRHALVNTGEIGAMGCKEDGAPWTLGIQHPRRPEAYVALTKLSDCCLATSGDYATRFSDDFLRHHIFDPANGGSPQELASVTVVAPSGLDADGASTAVMVLGPERGLRLLESFPSAEAFLVLKDNRTIKTPRFPVGSHQSQPLPLAGRRAALASCADCQQRQPREAGENHRGPGADVSEPAPGLGAGGVLVAQNHPTRWLRNGPLHVAVVVKSARIESVKVTQHTEKQFYSAITDTTARIIDKQGVKGVDMTSGATITAEAIVNATAKALAGGMK